MVQTHAPRKPEEERERERVSGYLRSKTKDFQLLQAVFLFGWCDGMPGKKYRREKRELTFHSLLGTNLNQLRASERDAAYIGEDVIGNDQAHRQEEPDHAFEDIVHDEVGLDDDQVERHMGPGELGELEAVVALLQGADEEDETWLRR